MTHTVRDADGDVEMVSPPVYEFVQAPLLSAWDQASLISWVRRRKQYEEKMRDRCLGSGENYDTVTVSIRNSIEPRILDHLARYVLKKSVAKVTDEDLGLAITRRCSTLKNAHIPDIDRLFREQLKMDLKQADAEARIMDYFVLFDRIVEENGLGGILGDDTASERSRTERMKLRCKILMDNLVWRSRRLQQDPTGVCPQFKA